MSHDFLRQRRKRAAEMVKDGIPFDEVLATLNMSLTSLRTACQEHDVTLPTKQVEEIGNSSYQIIALLLKGEKQIKIAQQFGISRQRVGQIRKKCIENGILPNDETIASG